MKEIYWWKHAAKCHQTSVVGESDLYYEDDVLARVKNFEEQERNNLVRSAIRNPPPPAGTYSLPRGYVQMAHAQAMPASGYLPPGSHMQAAPMPNPGAMTYGQAAIAQYHGHAGGAVAGPSHHVHPHSPITPLSPTAHASFLRMHAVGPPAQMPMHHMPQMSPVDATAHYGVGPSTSHASIVPHSAAEAAAAYIAATGGLPNLPMQ